MKKFIKSIFGKISLIVLFIAISICFLFTCGCAFINEQSDIFLSSKNEIEKDVIETYVDDIAYQITLDEIYDSAFKTNEFFNEYKYEIVDKNNKIVYSGSGGSDYTSASLKEIEYTHTFYIDKTEDELYWNYVPESNYYETYKITFVANYDVNSNRLLAFEINALNFAYTIRNLLYPLCILSILLMIIIFITLMWSAGRRSEDEQIHNSVLFILPYDILFIASLGFVSLTILGALKTDNKEILVSYILFAGIISEIIALILCMELANRIKLKKLLDTCLLFKLLVIIFKILFFIPKELFKVLRNLVDGIRKYPLAKRIAIILIIYEIFELNFINSYSRFDIWLIKALVVVPLVLYITICFKKIEDGVDKMSKGNYDYKIDSKHMHGDIKKLSDQINNISSGMSIAVNEKVKSEKMKTELITNVTHDIKTPLTSIINYTDLISKEKTNKKVKGYSEVLLRQANKLKRLIDDLVEVSKASTGNLDVELVPSDITTLLSQVEGEYDEKLSNSSLNIVINYPTEEIVINADPRRMWRIFDNLMNNICKYGQPDTRVYLSCEKKDGYAYIYFKNTSKESLNIDPNELRERFVRGESSRNTEGNGLGLSIVESLTELQGGEFNIEIDGDLFKAILKFPITK